MQDNSYIISDNQAKQIANCIYLDIADYIQKNEAKYQKWIKEQNKKGGEL